MELGMAEQNKLSDEQIAALVEKSISHSKRSILLSYISLSLSLFAIIVILLALFDVISPLWE